MTLGRSFAVWQPFAMELPLSSPAKCELRSVIRFLNAKKNSPVEIHRQLVEVYGEKCMDIKNVRKWCREFNEGRINVHDEQRSGRPSLPDSTVARIDEMVRSNRRITLEEIEDGLNEDCSHFSVHKIVSETLGYSKVSARWVPRQLTDDHKRQRVESDTEFLRRYEEEGEDFLDSLVTGDETWAHHYTPETKEQSKQWRHTTSPKPKKFKTTLSAGKVMATVFWDRKGVLLVDFLPKGETINSERYCETLTKLRRAIQNKRRGRLTKGVVLLHDNARVHVSRQTTAKLEEFGWDIFGHPPYSPDLAPSDYHMFPALKKHLGGQKFSSDEEVEEAVNKWLKEAAGEWYNAGIKKLVDRMKKVIERQGDYVEK